MKRQTLYIILGGLLIIGVGAFLYVRSQGGVEEMAKDAALGMVAGEDRPRPRPAPRPSLYSNVDPNDIAPTGGSLKDRLAQTLTTSVHENRHSIFNGVTSALKGGLNGLKKKVGTRQNRAAVTGGGRRGNRGRQGR
jgi:hypothetical protein